MLKQNISDKYMKKLIVLLLLTTTVCYGQFSGDKKKIYSLEECISVALANNFDIRLSDSRVEAAEAEVTSAFGDYLPNINVNLGYSRQLNAKPGFGLINGQLVRTDSKPNSYDVNASARLTLFDGFARDNNYRGAHESLNATDYSSQFTKQQVKLQVYSNYIDVIANYQIVKIRKENLELGKKELERIKAQSEAGLIPIDVVYSQEADLGNKEYDLVQAENNLQVSKANLLKVMGLSPHQNVDFLETSLPTDISSEDINTFRNDIGSLSSAINSAMRNRLDYQATESSMEAAEAGVTAAKASYYPTISASGGWYWSNSELERFSDLGRSAVGLSFYIPIFNNFNVNNRIQTAQLQLKQRDIDRRKLEQNIKSSVKTAFLNLEASEKQLEITKRALKAAELSYNSAKEKFRVGSSNVTDYLAANARYITAQINRINAVYRYIQSKKELLFSVGKMKIFGVE